MNFKQFLLEEQFDLEKFKSDCEFYFEQTKGNSKLFLYHGTRNYPKDYGIMRFKERTAPRNSDQIMHDSVNSYFNKEFGFPFRSGLFCVGSPSTAGAYGNPLAIFPIGKFEWICSTDKDFNDMTGTFDDIRAHEASKRNTNRQETLEDATDILLKMVKAVDWNHDKNLVDCLNSKNEIMIKCDRYYAFDKYDRTFDIIVEPYVLHGK